MCYFRESELQQKQIHHQGYVFLIFALLTDTQKG